MREEEPSPNASPPLEELSYSPPPPRRGKRSCSLASHRRASWKSKFYRFDKEGNRWKERTDGTVKFPKNKVTSRGAITKRMTAIEEMAGMDVLCIDKTGTLTLNKLTVDKNLIEVFADGINQDMVVLMAARASRLENQDAIDCAIVSTLADPKEVISLQLLRKQEGVLEWALTYGFAGVFPALKIADIGIAVADATDAARSASDIVLTEPGLRVIISAVLTSRAIFQRMKNYTIYVVSTPSVLWLALCYSHAFGNLTFLPLWFLIGEMKQLMCFLRSIYDLARLEDEVDFLTAQSEQDRQKRNNVKFWHVFRSKEIRLAFLVGGGLLANKRHKAKGCCGWTSTGLKLSTRLWSMATSHKISRNWLQNRIDPICSSMDHLVKVENRTWKVDAGSRSIDHELTTLSSANHIEMSPSDAGFQDRYIVQEIIKEMAKNRPIDTKGKKGFKVLVLNDVDKLSREAPHSLRQTMEKYSAYCRLILCCNSSSRFTEAIRSRCLNVRINAPSEDKIVEVLEFIGKKEGLHLPPGFASRIAEKSNRNLRRAILSFETCRVQQYPFTNKQAIPPMDWEEYISEIPSDIMKEQSPKVSHTYMPYRLFLVRGKVYELLINCIPPEIILKEHRMRLGQKAIFHIEAFVAKFMSIYKSFLISTFG
ncbi:hypothetical protein AHAS_Ahas10G0184100 [Arachis hypogaea]